MARARKAKRTSADEAAISPVGSGPTGSGPAWHSKWMRGLLEACVLSTLAGGPAYGYEIAARFEDVGFARPKGGSLYPILGRLEKEGLVTPQWVNGESGPSRKYYELTVDGRRVAETIGPEWMHFSSAITELVSPQAATRKKA